MSLNKYFFLTLLIVVDISFLAAQPINTERLNTTDGLSNNRVYHIFQDSYGFLWIGTENGLNLYDGYTFKVFKNDPNNSESINSNVIWWIVEDGEKNLWIGTGEGVSKYLRAENKFKNYDLYGDYYSTAITYIDSRGRIWAGVETENILKYNEENDSWDEQEYVLIDSSRKYNNPRIVLEMTEDINNKLWITSIRHGLMWYDEKDKVFRQSEIMNEDETGKFTSNENFISSLYSDSTGVFWIATRNGIYKYNPVSKELKSIKKYTIDKLNYWNSFNHITQDHKGNVWIANNFRGILQFEGISDNFNRIEISGQSYSREGKSNVILTKCLWDKSGILWIGTSTQGLIKYDPNKKIFTHYVHEENNQNSISNSVILSLLESKIYPGMVYIGTRADGLNLFDTKTNSFSTLPFDVFEEKWAGSVRSILEEEDGSLWIGTWGEGLLKMNPQRKVVRRFRTDSVNINSISNANVSVIRKDPSGNLWIGTGFGGLNYLDVQTNTFNWLNSSFATYTQEIIDLIRNKISQNLDVAKITKVENFQNLTTEFEVGNPGNYLLVTAGEGTGSSPSMSDYGWMEDSNEKIVWNSDIVESTYHIGGTLKNRIKIEILQLKPGIYSLKYKSDDSHCYENWNSPPPR